MMLEPNKHIYFCSDNHLGIPDKSGSLSREKKFIRWLNSIQNSAQEIFLLGDLFDFWFEYKTVVPKGFVRVLGKLAEMVDFGIQVHFFVGNHDLWMIDYLKDEIGINIYRKPQRFVFHKTTFLLAHGDGLGPNDRGYKMMKKIFTFPFFQWLFRWLHPDIGMRLGIYLSTRKSLISGDQEVGFENKEQEWLYHYCMETLKTDAIDYFIFGHRHIPIDINLINGARYINTGDWVSHFSYAVFDGKNTSLKYFKN